jgi:hypothetical protein
MLLFVTPTERFSYSDTVLVDQFDIEPEVTLTKTVNIPLPFKTRRNGTLFFHAFLAKKTQKWNSDEWASALQDPTTSYAATAISVYQIPVQESFNLLRDKEPVSNLCFQMSKVTFIHFLFLIISMERKRKKSPSRTSTLN